MDVLQIVMPVLVMIILGMLCRKWKILTGEGVANMKVLVTNVMLPVAIFHALATAEYNKETGILILIMLIMLIVSFSLGFVLKPFLKGKYQRYLPFMVSVYEGGLMAYPLYTSLCGSENLSHVAVLDIGIVKRLNPLEIYARSTSLDRFGIPCQYGGAEYCRWYGTGIVIPVERWRLLTKDVSTEKVCRRLNIPYWQR